MRGISSWPELDSARVNGAVVKLQCSGRERKVRTIDLSSVTVDCYLSRCSLIVLVSSLLCLSVYGGEYCLRPRKEDGTEARSVVCCSAPAGWEGWKDDPTNVARTQELLKDPLTRALFQTSVWFFPSNCVAQDGFRMKSSECPSLTLKARACDSRAPPNVAQRLRDFVRELKQHPPDVFDDCDPVVSPFGSFDVNNFGGLTIWQIHCRKRRESRSWSSSNDYLLTMINRRDVLVAVYLAAADIKKIVPKLDSLKELARSVRITDSSAILPDIISVNVRLPESAIRDQLLRLTPLGSPVDDVYSFLESPRFYTDPLTPERGGRVHWLNGDIWMEIGHYNKQVPSVPRRKYSPPSEEEIRSQISAPVVLPPTTIVRAFWKFDKQRKLRDIEVRREVVEFNPKQ